LNLYQFLRIKSLDDDLMAALDDVVSENAVLGALAESFFEILKPFFRSHEIIYRYQTKNNTQNTNYNHTIGRTISL